jgi:hypothetical protein
MAILNFAGIPSVLLAKFSTLPEWKSYNPKSGYVMLLNDKVAAEPAFLKKEIDFLEIN